MDLRNRIVLANDAEDPREINRIASILRFRFNMNYRQSAEYFQQADPSIDAARFEELMQMADDFQS